MTHEDVVHLTAHVGISYTLTSLIYGATRLLTPDPIALVFGVVGALGIGLTYKLIEHAELGETKVSMSRNLIGVALAVVAVAAFGF